MTNLPSKGWVYHRLYENLGHGYLVQDEEARQLHSLAGVPEGPLWSRRITAVSTSLGFTVSITSHVSQ